MSTTAQTVNEHILGQEWVRTDDAFLLVDPEQLGTNPRSLLQVYRGRGWTGSVRNDGTVHLSSFSGTPEQFWSSYGIIRAKGAIKDGSAILAPVYQDISAMFTWANGEKVDIATDGSDPRFEKIISAMRRAKVSAQIEVHDGIARGLLHTAPDYGVDAEVVLTTGLFFKRHTIRLHGRPRDVHTLLEAAESL